MKNIYIFSVVIAFLFCASCKKDQPPNVLPPDTLPPITQTGANTFGCKINGQVWVPYYPCIDTYWNGAVELEYGFNSPNKNSVLPMGFGMIAQNSNDQNFLTIGTIGTIIYGKGNIIDTSLSIGFFNDTGYYRLLGGDPNNIFQITKLDTVNKIVSGIFSFTLYASFSDSVVITDGRFDLQITEQYSRCTN